LLVEDLHLARPGVGLAALMEERVLPEADQPVAAGLRRAHQRERRVVVDQHRLERVHEEAHRERSGVHVAATVTDQPACHRAYTLPHPIARRSANTRYTTHSRRRSAAALPTNPCPMAKVWMPLARW